MQLFESKVINTWGKKGQIWIKQLPIIVESLSKHWSLTDVKPVNNMSYNYVALATRNDNTPVVLKVSCDEQLIVDEYKTLQFFDGCGAIKLLDINLEYNAILLEQAISGSLLKDQLSIDIANTISIYTTVVKSLIKHPIPAERYTHVSNWCQAIDQIKDKRIETRYIEKAKELKTNLLSSAENEYLCHGDLHLENILQHQNKWLAIDPKGIIGEIAFEASAFDLVNKIEWSEPDNIPSLITERINLLAHTLQIDNKRLTAWIFIRSMISIQWFIEDNGNPDEMLRFMTMIYSLLPQNYNK